jgi:UvrD/REP helicase N-terminal domain
MSLPARLGQANEWTPIGVDELEASALIVVRSTENRSVIAGPGAGKTELLAQRAAYLLQTAMSPAPQRILAISFKRDAASNLGARVRERCHRQHACRFDSMTFDAFAKGRLIASGSRCPTGGGHRLTTRSCSRPTAAIATTSSSHSAPRRGQSEPMPTSWP